MYIYIYIHLYIYIERERDRSCISIFIHHIHTLSPPTESFPTKSPRVELSGRLPIKYTDMRIPSS